MRITKNQSSPRPTPSSPRKGPLMRTHAIAQLIGDRSPAVALAS